MLGASSIDLRAFFSADTRPKIEVEDTATVVISLVRILGTQNGKRAWEVKVTYNDEKIHEKPTMVLLDLFATKDYDDYFQFFAAGSFEPPKHKRPRGWEIRIREAAEEIQRYGDDLLQQLRLDSDHPTRHHKILNIFIVEDQRINVRDEGSLHNLVWELLEHPGCWKQRKPERVHITRIIGPPNYTSRIDSTLGPPNDQPVRILLIIGRVLEREHFHDVNFTYTENAQSVNWKYIETAPPSMIQHSLMQVIQYLEEVGCKRKIQLDILRPATIQELEKYLGVGENARDIVPQNFDIVHLDMHGAMQRPAPQSGEPDPGPAKQPHFIFTQEKRRGPHVLATKVAATLRDRTKLLVMNACNTSSTTGELGIQMIRPFLNEHMDCISATSYKLGVKPAAIYHSRFYMSLLLNGSRDRILKANFSRAAADGRLALRIDKRRHDGEERDDHYVHWNWSIVPRLHQCKSPVRSFRLHLLMFLECIPRFLTFLFACLRCQRDVWNETKEDRYPMYTVHRNFENIESHARSARQLPIPSITLYALDIEFKLKSHAKHSVYLHTRLKNSSFELERIRSLIRKMVRIWVETNFVTEAHILHIDEMLNQGLKGNLEARYKFPFWKSTYDVLSQRPEWTWRQSETFHGRKQPEIKSMLIVDGIHSLVPPTSERQFKILNRIREVAKELEERNGDRFYLITIGGLSESEWNKNLPTEDFSRDRIGIKWARAAALMIPWGTDHEPSMNSND